MCVGIAALLALSGCATGPFTGVPVTGPLAVHPRVDAGMDALLEGTLRTDDDCIRVEYGESGESVAVPSFPAGDASVEGRTLTWRGETYGDGGAIALGGGFANSGGYVPGSCGEAEVFVVSPY
ncbi:hypothetical protein [Microbacterium hominis]|uniref:Lipoprotein n=1 Tax=Microbacterium hominis TaxID=162426 RepID=A0A7D4PSQ6_9MICO|nr:hypothetical protein [Microbacterium hominis]QKJ18233.1 hypothetical protein HQM25_01665 [Microbacterium hominis]